MRVWGQLSQFNVITKSLFSGGIVLLSCIFYSILMLCEYIVVHEKMS